MKCQSPSASFTYTCPTYVVPTPPPTATPALQPVELVSGTVGEASCSTPKNDDACLQNSPSWGSKYACNGEGGTVAQFSTWCTSWAKDMWRCCPEECNRNSAPLSQTDCDSLPGSGSCPSDYTDKGSLTQAAQCP